MEFTSDIIIGLEIHVQLKTRTKLFCGCPTQGLDEPNTRVCPVCLGHPGSKPVLNKKALELGMKISMALNARINPQLIFSRKSYFYPDMSKNYQITQYEVPLAEQGFISVNNRDIHIVRAHLEEDPAALVHPAGMHSSNYVLVDYNRSGNPLIEIVTAPDMTSPDEAREFMRRLINILTYLDAFDPKNGIIKADANISIRESGYIRSEVKNVTGFKEIEHALAYEVKRQRHAVKMNEKLVMDTRSWDADLGVTKRIRTKETEADYGYIIDPDLVITDLTDTLIQKMSAEIPELPSTKRRRYTEQLGLSEMDADVLTSDIKLARMFDAVSQKVDPTLAARWIRRELTRVINYNKIDLADVNLDPHHLIDLLSLVQENRITDTTAQKLMEKLIIEPFNIPAYVKKNNLEAVNDTGELRSMCKKAIDISPKAIEDYKAGNEKSLNYVVGQVMRMSKGKADPAEVNRLLREML